MEVGNGFVADGIKLEKTAMKSIPCIFSNN